MATRIPPEVATKRMRYYLSRLQTTPQFTAVLDCLFDLPSRTEPPFAELALVGERLLFARAQGDTTFRYFVGRREQLIVDLIGLVTHLNLGTGEREYVLSRVDSISRRAAR